MAVPLTADLVRPLAPARPADGHKGTFGHALLVAGSPGYTGAGCLAAEAAARAGAGLVTLACPASLNDLFEVKLTEVMTLPVAESADRTFTADSVAQVVSAAARRSAVGLGPGLGRGTETHRFVIAAVPQLSVPLCIDADGLNHLGTDVSSLLPRDVPCVLTPHPGEMARLTGLTIEVVRQQREEIARSHAEQWRCTVVLKGAPTLVVAPDGRVWTNTTGNHGLASGGTGDVLTGVVTGLLAQGCAPEEAACLAVYLHGWAGDAIAARSSPRSLLAGDLLAELPAAWRALLGVEVDPPA